MPVYLRELDVSDLESIVAMANNPLIANDMCTLPSPFTMKDAQELLKRAKGEREVIRGIAEINGDKLAGTIMLRDFESCHEQAELSIWIGQDHWGKGYGTSAVMKMTEFGFSNQQLNRVYAYCMVRNQASQRILEKSGFTKEGLLRERVIISGIYEDVFLYARLKKDGPMKEI